MYFGRTLEEDAVYGTNYINSNGSSPTSFHEGSNGHLKNNLTSCETSRTSKNCSVNDNNITLATVVLSWGLV